MIPPPPPPPDRVPLREQAGLGAGKLVTEGTHLTLHVLVNPIYNVTLGVSPWLISTVVFIQRIWDAMLDPVLGQFSDNFRSRWGRRLPLLGAATLPLAVLFAALWWFPRGASEHALFTYLLVASLVFYGAHSLYAMPLAGLAVEATDDDHERTRLAAPFIGTLAALLLIRRYDLSETGALEIKTVLAERRAAAGQPAVVA